MFVQIMPLVLKLARPRGHVLHRLMYAPRGVLGSGEKGYLFSRSRGALVIIFKDLRSKLVVLGI